MERSERRKYRRLGARFDISCRQVGSEGEQSHSGCTVNVSAGGLYFETSADVFRPGNMLKVELSIPPTSGVLDFGGKLAGFAEVLRAEDICGSAPEADSSSDRYGVALQFCRPPRLCI
jgi:hypothetical protein